MNYDVPDRLVPTPFRRHANAMVLRAGYMYIYIYIYIYIYSEVRGA